MILSRNCFKKMTTEVKIFIFLSRGDVLGWSENYVGRERVGAIMVFTVVGHRWAPSPRRRSPRVRRTVQVRVWYAQESIRVGVREWPTRSRWWRILLCLELAIHTLMTVNPSPPWLIGRASVERVGARRKSPGERKPPSVRPHTIRTDVRLSDDSAETLWSHSIAVNFVFFLKIFLYDKRVV